MMTRLTYAPAVLFAVWDWLCSARTLHNSNYYAALPRIVCFVGLVAGGLLLSTVSPSYGQSVWDAPATPSNPWQIDRAEADQDEREAEHNPWSTNDPWGTDDAWGGNNPWNEDEAYSGGSDWARDFYDFDDASSDDSRNGSARRVGDGPTMMASACNGGSGCTGGKVCCLKENGTPNCSNNCNGNNQVDEQTCADNPDNPQCQTNCENNSEANAGDGCNAVETVPVDGGLLYLIALGLAFGAYKLT